MKINPVTIISLSLVTLTLGILVLAQLLGYIPDKASAQIRSRIQLAESLAIQLSVLTQRGEFEVIQTVIDDVVERNKLIDSVALRSSNGDRLAGSDGHPGIMYSSVSTPDFMMMPLYENEKEWGRVEIQFVPLNSTALMGVLDYDFLKLLFFVTLAGFTVYLLLLRKVLRHLDPYSVIPARVGAVMNAMSDGVCLIDERDNIVLVNNAFSSMTGIPEKNLIRLKLSKLKWFVLKNNNINSKYPWLNAIAKKTGYSNKVMRYSLPDGDISIFSSNATTILDSNNKLCGALVTFDDITQLEHSNELLQRQRETERQRIRWLENMATFLRHEMNVALTGAASSVNLLERSAHFDDEDKRLLGLTSNSHYLIKELVETVCEATSLESSFLKEATQEVRLDILMKDYTSNYQYIYPGKKIVCHLDENEIVIKCQEERIMQMLDKLVSNAIDHTSNDSPIIIACEKKKNHVILKVSNEGETLPVDKDAIFELFESRRVKTKTNKNKGIGLYVVRLIAEGYGGKVEAFNRDDVPGAEFVITLPIVA